MKIKCLEPKLCYYGREANHPKNNMSGEQPMKEISWLRKVYGCFQCLLDFLEKIACLMELYICAWLKENLKVLKWYFVSLNEIQLFKDYCFCLKIVNVLFMRYLKCVMAPQLFKWVFTWMEYLFTWIWMWKKYYSRSLYPWVKFTSVTIVFP